MLLVHRITDSASTFFDKHNQAAKLTLTAVAAAALTASAIFSYQGVQRQLRVRSLKQELLSEKPHGKKLSQWGTVADEFDYDESLIDEQLARNIAFLGMEGVDKVRKANVVVIGVGAVGSHCALMLARSGVQRIRLVDPAIISLQTLAHHATAGHDDIGRPTVLALKREIQKIARFVNVECRVEKLTVLNIADILSGSPDFVVDAMGGQLESKAQLAKYCSDRKLKLVSSMSLDGKADPTRMQIADISNTVGDPQCCAFRRRLRKLGVEHGLFVAFSSEKPYPARLLTNGGETIQVDSKIITDFPSRHLPVFGPSSGMFGMMLAAHIILYLGDFSSYHCASPSAHGFDSKRTRDALDDIRRREKANYTETSLALEAADVGYILDEMWHQKSVVSGSQKKLTLVRWERSKPQSYLNAVAMSRTEAAKHDALPTNANLREIYGDGVVDFVSKQMELERQLQLFL